MGLGRWIAELRGAPSQREVDEALSRLRASRAKSDAELVALVGGGLAVDDAIVEVNHGDGPEHGGARGGARGPVDAMHDAAVVRLGRDVYARVPTREGRVRLLSMARRAASSAVVAHVTIANEGSYLGRVVVDGPRKVLRAAHVRVAEPGDRFGPNRYAHCFFDEETLLEEIGQAGLVLARRRGSTFVLRSGAAASERAEPFAIEVARVGRMVREVDAARATETPRTVLSAMRARGTESNARGPVGRARLRRAIGWIDAVLPGEASCYRRVLLEVALDAGAARETVVFGLDVGSTGHVAFEDSEDGTFDVTFAIPAE